MHKAIYLLNKDKFNVIYGPEEQSDISKRVEIVDSPISAEDLKNSDKVWDDVEFIFSGWGMAPVDETFLKRFPKLKVIFYGAGSIKYFISDALWNRNIRVTSAFAMNAVPVCEFSVAQIFLGLKQTWQHALHIRTHKKHAPRIDPAGGFRSTVSLLSLGMIGCMVAERLKSSDLKVIAYDPFAKPEKAKQLNIELVSLDEAFSRADVVSCHTPWLKETENMIRGRHFEMMKNGATFLNTARGAVVNETEMVEALRKRPDLMAVLDVTWPEPPPEDSPLHTLDNIVMTPHIAGSLGNECRRMGRCMVDEFDRYAANQPMKYEINKEQAKIMA